MTESTLYTHERIFMWELYPHMLQWHQHHRQFIKKDMQGEPRNHINALIIISSAIMIESTLKSLLLFYLEDPFSPFLNSTKVNTPQSLFHDRTTQALIDDVNSSSWSSSKKLFSLITSKSLSEMTSTCWIDITKLFEFRNLLAHGNEVSRVIEWDRKQGLKALKTEHSHAKGVLHYLENKKFIAQPQFGKNLGWSFLSDEIADHFLCKARQFLQLLADKAPDSNEDQTLPKRIKHILKETRPDHDSPSILLYQPIGK